MALGQRHSWRRLDELNELNARLCEGLFEAVLRARGLDKHADFAFAVGDILDDALGGAVTQGVLVGVPTQREHDGGKGLDIEQIMLSRYCEFLGHDISLAFLRVLIALVDEALGLVLA